MNKHHKKVMKRQKNVQSNAQIAKIFWDLYNRVWLRLANKNAHSTIGIVLNTDQS